MTAIAGTWVRCRDGGLYLNPLLVFPEGFVCFPAGQPELVLWAVDMAGQPLTERFEFGTVLRWLFGDDAAIQPVEARSEQRVFPGSEPYVFRPALVAPFELKGRIPQPQMHDGVARYPRQCGGLPVLELPAQPRDAYRLRVQ